MGGILFGEPDVVMECESLSVWIVGDGHDNRGTTTDPCGIPHLPACMSTFMTGLVAGD